jgi:hypothetical protein
VDEELSRGEVSVGALAMVCCSRSYPVLEKVSVAFFWCYWILDGHELRPKRKNDKV